MELVVERPQGSLGPGCIFSTSVTDFTALGLWNEITQFSSVKSEVDQLFQSGMLFNIIIVWLIAKRS